MGAGGQKGTLGSPGRSRGGSRDRPELAKSPKSKTIDFLNIKLMISRFPQTPNCSSELLRGRPGGSSRCTWAALGSSFGFRNWIPDLFHPLGGTPGAKNGLRQGFFGAPPLEFQRKVLRPELHARISASPFECGVFQARNAWRFPPSMSPMRKILH